MDIQLEAETKTEEEKEKREGFLSTYIHTLRRILPEICICSLIFVGGYFWGKVQGHYSWYNYILPWLLYAVGYWLMLFRFNTYLDLQTRYEMQVGINKRLMEMCIKMEDLCERAKLLGLKEK
jgi:hypothetical protein